MLISSFLSCALLLVQGAICSDLREDPPRDNEELAKQLITDTNPATYGYNHPPVPEVNKQERSRKGKSINIDEQTTRRTHSRGIRRRGKPTASTPSLEIPVQVIYETAPTTIRSTSESTISTSDRTTRVSVRRRKLQSNTNKKNIRRTTAAPSNIALPSSEGNVPIFTEKNKSLISTTELPKRSRGSHSYSNKKIDMTQTSAATINSALPSSKGNVPIFTEKNKSLVLTTDLPKRSRGSHSNTNKKIDIRQITPATYQKITTIANVTGNAPTLTEKDKGDVSATEFPKRSRDSYFKKRTEGPAPNVKILEEKNFVFSHSGNFHYSFLGGDGTKVSSEGSLKSYENNKTGESVSGSVFYKDKDGNDYNLSYTADENGYRPIGAHLPTPPPIPPAIARALKYIADMSTPLPIAEIE